jgi:hypothetical protein
MSHQARTLAEMLSLQRKSERSSVDGRKKEVHRIKSGVASLFRVVFKRRPASIMLARPVQDALSRTVVRQSLVLGSRLHADWPQVAEVPGRRRRPAPRRFLKDPLSKYLHPTAPAQTAPRRRRWGHCDHRPPLSYPCRPPRARGCSNARAGLGNVSRNPFSHPGVVLQDPTQYC